MAVVSHMYESIGPHLRGQPSESGLVRVPFRIASVRAILRQLHLHSIAFRGRTYSPVYALALSPGAIPRTPGGTTTTRFNVSAPFPISRAASAYVPTLRMYVPIKARCVCDLRKESGSPSPFNAATADTTGGPL